MSRYIHIYIEYKNKKKSNWKLFCPTKDFNIEKSGVIRNIISDNFSYRGIPEDINVETENKIIKEFETTKDVSFVLIEELISYLEKRIERNSINHKLDTILSFIKGENTNKEEDYFQEWEHEEEDSLKYTLEYIKAIPIMIELINDFLDIRDYNIRLIFVVQ